MHTLVWSRGLKGLMLNFVATALMVGVPIGLLWLLWRLADRIAG